MKNIIFTGAGASKPLNYPTTIEFFSDTENYDMHKMEFFNHLKRHLKVNILDIEEALHLLENADVFLGTDAGLFVSTKLTDNWRQRIAKFTSYCRDRCFAIYGVIPEESKVEELYLPLLSGLGWENNDISLFTANYDPVTDTILEIAENKGISAYDGFGPRGDWKPEGYKIKSNSLNIYRVHGSMSWIQQKTRIKNTRDYSLRLVTDHDHLIIYPGYKGNPESEAHEVFRFPHAQLKEQLLTADKFVVIGFSFRDIHLNDIFKSSMENNTSLQLIVLNPDWPSGLNGFMDNLRKKYKSRVVHASIKFGDKDSSLMYQELFK